MTAFSFSRWVVVSVIATTTASGSLAAENVARDGLPAKYVKRIKEYQNALDKLDDFDQAKGIYRNSSLWGPNYPKIRVCFFEGTQALREVVANVAKEWMAEDNSIKLDFGKPGKDVVLASQRTARKCRSASPSARRAIGRKWARTAWSSPSRTRRLSISAGS